MITIRFSRHHLDLSDWLTAIHRRPPPPRNTWAWRRRLEGWKFREIAAALGVSIGRARQIAYAGLSALKDRWYRANRSNPLERVVVWTPEIQALESTPYPDPDHPAYYH